MLRTIICFLLGGVPHFGNFIINVLTFNYVLGRIQLQALYTYSTMPIHLL